MSGLRKRLRRLLLQLKLISIPTATIMLTKKEILKNLIGKKVRIQLLDGEVIIHYNENLTYESGVYWVIKEIGDDMFLAEKHFEKFTTKEYYGLDKVCKIG